LWSQKPFHPVQEKQAPRGSRDQWITDCSLRFSINCNSLCPLTEDSPNSPEPASTRPRWIGRIVAYLGIWIVVLATLTVQRALWSEVSWPQAIIVVVRDWLPWVVLGPMLWWLVKRFPLFGKQRLRNFGLHLVISIVMVVLAETLVAFVIYPATQPAMEQAELSERDQRREIRGVRKRPFLRNNDYQFRTRTMVRKAPGWFLLNWVFVLIGTSVLQRRINEERTRKALALQRNLAEARLRELQSRLQPHFLFNALNSVSALIHTDVEKADEMLNRLSTLLRRVLVSGEKPLIPLREEMGLVQDYLAIEQVRYSDRLTVVETIDPETLSILVPPMILQPLAENAVKHGIEPKSTPSTLRVVSEKKESGELVIRIQNDGMDPDTESESRGHGVGLENVRSRLENAFGDEAALTLRFPEEGGALVELVLPSEKKEDS